MGERVAAAVTANKSRQVYWQTLRSELAANQALFAAPVSENENYAGLPLILLSADPSYEGVPDDVRDILEQALAQTRQRILAGSNKSKRIDVPGASHDIQLEQPEAVASAVGELLGKP
jgi:pimeloyl-ACP methyl ester carboxylesterase